MLLVPLFCDFSANCQQVAQSKPHILKEARLGMRFAIILSVLSVAASATPPDIIRTPNNVVIPRLEKAPSLDAFSGMEPSSEWRGKLVKIDAFLQRDPKDGAPPMSRTVAYMGYDQKSFYVVFVCFDDQPGTIRSRLARRDTIGPEDDEVQLYLDTFNDKRRSYGFMTNPKD
jgi:hypothetical protein